MTAVPITLERGEIGVLDDELDILIGLESFSEECRACAFLTAAGSVTTFTLRNEFTIHVISSPDQTQC